MSNYVPGKYITVFADASFCHKTRSTGYACWIKHGSNGKTERFSGITKKLSNSTEAEYHALVMALSYIDNFIDTENKILSIQSDCIPALDKLRLSFTNYLTEDYELVTFKHVKGHQNSINARSAVNEWCDRVAKEKMAEIRGY